MDVHEHWFYVLLPDLKRGEVRAATLESAEELAQARWQETEEVGHSDECDCIGTDWEGDNFTLSERSPDQMLAALVQERDLNDASAQPESGKRLNIIERVTKWHAWHRT
jgi:hypothetical protein